MSNLPVADLLAAAVIVICIIISLTRGIIAEAGAMVAWVVSFIAARTLAVPFADVVFKSVEPHALAVAMGFAAVFFLAWLLQKLARSLLSSLMSAVGLGSINRLLGGVFGAVKGVILVTLAVMVFSHTDLPKTEEWQSSHTIPYFESLADAAMPYLPGKDTAMSHLSGKAAEVEELDD